MGIGWTAVASKLTNRNFIGIEIEKQYFDIAKDRTDNTNSTEFKRINLLEEL